MEIERRRRLEKGHRLHAERLSRQITRQAGSPLEVENGILRDFYRRDHLLLPGIDTLKGSLVSEIHLVARIGHGQGAPKLHEMLQL